MATDFTSWSEKEIIAFLDRRGEDYEDCIDAFALVARAQECEHNTGPATRPDLKDEGTAPEEEDDALEAFMAEIEQDVKQAEATASEKKPANTTAACDAEDDMDDYIEAHAAQQEREAAGASKPSADTRNSDDEEQEVEAHREIKPLEDVDHSKISYESFKKDFYDESPDVFVLDDEEVRQQRALLEISAQGRDVPKPVSSFEQCGFPSKLMSAVTNAGFSKPTAVQSQVLPAALSGRDVVGIAQTGSGKTAAFLLPMVVHCAAQSRVRPGQGPIAIIIAPVRELAEQIHREARRFCKPLGLRVCAAFGGMQKHAQKRELLGGVEVAVATPGRLIDLVECGACKLQRVTMFVVDEVDRCFDLGFEAQVQSIVRATRPDRQTLLFSATLPQRVKQLVRDSLTNEVSVTVGHAGAAHADVQQEVLLMPNADAKMQWLQARMPRLVDEGQVVVFVNSRAVVDGIVTLLQGARVKVGGIHGDLDQFSRSSVLPAFKAGTTHVMVATDVAARGLDIRSVKIVVNYDVARSFESHVHRIGRTGRAGDAGGRAITLIMPQETRMAAAIAESLQAGGKPVPKNLQDIALKNPGYRKMSGVPKKGPKAPAVGGAGLGFGSASAVKPPSFVAATNPNPPPAPSAAGSSGKAASAQQPSASTDLQQQETPAATPGSRFGGFAPAAAAQPPLAPQPGLPGPPPRPHGTPVQSTTAIPPGGVVGEKRSFSEAAAPARPAQQAAHTSAAAAPQAAVTIKAPKGFVKSSLKVGGDDHGPQIVLPTAAGAAKAEAPAAWLQKRIQQKKQFGSAGGYQVRPAATAQQPAAPMDAQSMAEAVRKAQEAAARIMGSSQSVTHTTTSSIGGASGPSGHVHSGHFPSAPNGSGGAAMGASAFPPHSYSQAYAAQAPPAAAAAAVQPPWQQQQQQQQQQYSQAGVPPHPLPQPQAYGGPSAPGVQQLSAAQPHTQPPRLTPEEARRLAQEAAQRASMSAAQKKGEKWEWAKT